MTFTRFIKIANMVDEGDLITELDVTQVPAVGDTVLWDDRDREGTVHSVNWEISRDGTKISAEVIIS